MKQEFMHIAFNQYINSSLYHVVWTVGIYSDDPVAHGAVAIAAMFMT